MSMIIETNAIIKPSRYIAKNQQININYKSIQSDFGSTYGQW
jgi:hypothetical protein